MRSTEVILHAKIEYTKQLQSLVKKPLYNTLSLLFEDSKSQKEVLKTFQTKLATIPNWNQDTIYEKYNQIISKISEKLFEKLIQAIIISNVKIFGAIKKNHSAKIEVTLPDPRQFIHKIYINCARAFYQTPFLFDNRPRYISLSSVTKNNVKISKIIDECIEETIRSVLPFSNILEEYFKEEPDLLDEGDASNLNKEIDTMLGIHEEDEGDESSDEDGEEAVYADEEQKDEDENEDEEEAGHEETEQEEDIKEVNLKEETSENELDEADEEFFNN